ncbi:MAG: GerAB/ArcD/ProY family transporter [bacterium]
MPDRRRISSFQAIAILTGTLIGVSILILPGTAAAASGSGGWLAVFLTGLVSLFPLAVITALGRRFPRQNIIQYSDSILGRYLGKLVAITFSLYWLVLTAVTVRFFGAVLVTSLLFRTPLEITVIIMLLLTAYLVQFDIKVFGRVQEVFFFFYLIALLPLPFAVINRLQPLHLLPAAPTGLAGLLPGIAASAAAYLGLEVTAMFQTYYTEPKKALLLHTVSLAAVTVIYTTVTILAIGVFSAEALTAMQWPALELIKTANLPGLFFERSDALFVSVWLTAVFTTVATFYHCSARALADVVGLRSQAKLALPLVPFLFYLAVLPRNTVETMHFFQILANFGSVLILTVPLFLLAVAVLRGKGGRTDAH